MTKELKNLGYDIHKLRKKYRRHLNEKELEDLIKIKANDEINDNLSLKVLKVSNQNLEGFLDLSDFINL